MAPIRVASVRHRLRMSCHGFPTRTTSGLVLSRQTSSRSTPSHRARSGIRSARHRQRVHHARHIAEVLADHVEVEWPAHDDGGILAQNGDGIVRAEIQAAEQLVKIGEADRARDHAEKAAVGAGDAPAQHDRIGAVMQHRAADEQPGVGLVAMDLEIFLVAAIFRNRIQRRGVDGQPSPGVEHLDRAEMLGGGGMIEQDQMADLFADALDLRHHHAARHRTQRQVEKLDVAADVGVDGGGEVFQRLPRQLFLAAAHVEQHAGADRGEADHGRHRRGDQQLRR